MNSFFRKKVNRKRFKNSGMTLVEMIVSFALLSLIVAASTVIISNVTILFVFIFTVGLIYFMTRSIVEAARKAEAKHEEQNGKEN